VLCLEAEHNNARRGDAGAAIERSLAIDPTEPSGLAIASRVQALRAAAGGIEEAETESQRLRERALAPNPRVFQSRSCLAQRSLPSLCHNSSSRR